MMKNLFVKNQAQNFVPYDIVKNLALKRNFIDSTRIRLSNKEFFWLAEKPKYKSFQIELFLIWLSAPYLKNWTYYFLKGQKFLHAGTKFVVNIKISWHHQISMMHKTIFAALKQNRKIRTIKMTSFSFKTQFQKFGFFFFWIFEIFSVWKKMWKWHETFMPPSDLLWPREKFWAVTCVNYFRVCFQNFAFVVEHERDSTFTLSTLQKMIRHNHMKLLRLKRFSLRPLLEYEMSINHKFPSHF